MVVRAVNCWPEDIGGGKMNVNLEYTLQPQSPPVDLNNVVIVIPLCVRFPSIQGSLLSLIFCLPRRLMFRLLCMFTSCPFSALSLALAGYRLLWWFLRVNSGTTAAPDIVSCDGTTTVNAKAHTLEWKIDMIDDSNSSGVLEFNIAGRSADAFFPVNVSFSSTSTLCDVDVSACFVVVI